MKRSVLVFDADDTLWMNEYQYSQAYSEFFAYLYSQFKDCMPNLNAVKIRFDELDRALFPQWGVKRGRVAEAMVQAFSELLEYFRVVYPMRRPPFQARRALSPRRLERIEAEIRKIGDKPFRFRKLRWIPNAAHVIWELGWYQGNGVALLTSYDEKVWPKKARRLFGDEMPFDRIRTVPGKKTKEDFVEVSGWGKHPDGIKFYAVGNGPSDLLPALEISDEWHAIYIPHGSTSAFFENHPGTNPYIPPPIDDPRVLTIQHIRQMRCIDLANFGLKHDLNKPCEKCALPSM